MTEAKILGWIDRAIRHDKTAFARFLYMQNEGGTWCAEDNCMALARRGQMLCDSHMETRYGLGHLEKSYEESRWPEYREAFRLDEPDEGKR